MEGRRLEVVEGNLSERSSGIVVLPPTELENVKITLNTIVLDKPSSIEMISCYSHNPISCPDILLPSAWHSDQTPRPALARSRRLSVLIALKVAFMVEWMTLSGGYFKSDINGSR